MPSSRRTLDRAPDPERRAGAARGRQPPLKSAQAWEVEAGLIYDDFAWFLYDELWELSVDRRPELVAVRARERIDQLLDPLLDPTLPDGDRGVLVVDVFRAVLTARMQPLLRG